MFSKFVTKKKSKDGMAAKAAVQPVADDEDDATEPQLNVVQFNGHEENSLLLSDKVLEAKVRLHRRLIDEINLPAIEKLPEAELKSQLNDLVREYVADEKLALNANELADFIEEIFDELTGLGPIEPLLKDPTISDILINTHRTIYVERFGQLVPTSARFKDEPHLLRIVNKIVAAVGRRVDESQPLCDARLLDGSRVNVAIKPVAIDGPLVSIRKFSKQPFSMDKLVTMDACAFRWPNCSRPRWPGERQS